jgi:hypothetical protein
MRFMAIPERNGIYGWVDVDEYHADRESLSVSGAKLLLPPSCPAKFRHHMDHPQKPKRHFEFGHFVHLKVLGKGPKVKEIDADSYRTKAARQARDIARANGDIPVLVGNPNDDAGAELEQAEAMTAAVFAHPEAGPLLTHPKNNFEQAVYAIDPQTGVRLRGRVDAINFADPQGRLRLIDLKTSTTADPEQFERKAAGFGYHMQAAWYMDLLILNKLAVDPAFMFVVVEKEPPYLVSVVEYGPAEIAEGRRLNREAINTYRECITSNKWPSYPGTDGVIPISLPAWALNDEMVI